MRGANIGRLLRGAARNAAVWAIGWFVVVLAVAVVLSLFELHPLGRTWLDGLGLALKAGVIGGVAGGAFALAIALLYRGRHLAKISWWRFALGGGILTGLFIPLFLQAMNILSGDGVVPMALVADDAVMGFVLGTVLAGGSLRLAQRAEAEPAIEAGARTDSLSEGDPFGRSVDTARRREAVDVDE